MRGWLVFSRLAAWRRAARPRAGIWLHWWWRAGGRAGAVVVVSGSKKNKQVSAMIESAATVRGRRSSSSGVVVGSGRYACGTSGWCSTAAASIAHAAIAHDHGMRCVATSVGTRC